MKTEQFLWLPEAPPPPALNISREKVQLALLFGSGESLGSEPLRVSVRTLYPNAILVGCSSAGDIHGTQVTDDTVSVTAVEFASTRMALHWESIPSGDASAETGRLLGRKLELAGLRHVFVLSAGLNVNGSELVKGLNEVLPPDVRVSGGLAGDGTRFVQTWVWADGELQSDRVVALGFYGDALRVGCAATGPWDAFGPERLVTKSRDSEVFEFDGQPALALYKSYLGDQSDALPASGLFFPIALRDPEASHSLIRTLLAVDEARQSVTFAGSVPQGSWARLVMSDVDHLIKDVRHTADDCIAQLGGLTPELSILVSCVGRRMVLGQRTEDELDAVDDAGFGQVPLTGFYSYGEICPSGAGMRAELHNQTLTITTFAETAPDTGPATSPA